jgi:hypothetical protein
MSKEFIEPFIDILEIGRPINRVCNYNVLLAPITDLTGNEIPLYKTSDANVYTKKAGYNYTLDGTSISYLKNSSVYEIKHNLANEYINVQFFDSDLKTVKSKSLKFINNNKLEVDFGREIEIYALISKANQGYINTTTSDS